MTVVILVGLPGSGKSTYAATKRLPVLSSDEIRKLLLDDVTDQSGNREVFETLRSLLQQRLEFGRPLTCIDATSLTRSERRQYIRIAEAYGANVEAVYLAASLAVCKRRNRKRERVVPDDVMERMAAKLQPPEKREGFTRVTVLSATSVARKARRAPAKA
ncbi:MAG: AAA family ATPase [Candidatus Solibacter usitatus]|nr:AAA family ATPase [Candidatus Solibacter usitatus]